MVGNPLPFQCCSSASQLLQTANLFSGFHSWYKPYYACVDTTHNHVLIDAYHRIINSLHLITRFTQSCHWYYNLVQCKYIFIGLHLNAALIIYCIDSFTSSMLDEVICNKNSDDSFQRYSLALQCRFYIQSCNNPNGTKWYSYLYMWHSYFEMHNLLYKTGFLPDWTKKLIWYPEPV